MVTLKELNQYKLLKREIDDLRKRIIQYEQVANEVTPSRLTLQVSKTSGQKRLYKKFLRKTKQLEKKSQQIEAYISTIEDGLVRQIIRLHFMDGLNWRDVAQSIGEGNTQSSVIMAFKKFYQKEHR